MYCWKQSVSTWSVLRSYLEDNWGDQFSSAQFSSVREPVRRELQPGGRGIAIVGAVTRKCLVIDLRTLDCVL
jgi:hypothetical protein